MSIRIQDGPRPRNFDYAKVIFSLIERCRAKYPSRFGAKKFSKYVQGFDDVMLDIQKRLELQIVDIPDDEPLIYEEYEVLDSMEFQLKCLL